ncbi:glycoside hydrolase family 73 protein [Pararobbsia silviterrae]|uniref:Mannosyl-glycoprotein endo-beta-N-acetylglucosamidase n=1 Tax=Pararobbsia silviterrae TaxID=1792498 RepID=A0A494WZ21_9BURK|nr:glucosaminidase domain-containing protein [Pararobbsia silviterrae]RKP43785.1 mannosyl-glycoprotein endo-beta-N-acetylglucosamidase [Pararobbsia silviterrae]
MTPQETFIATLAPLAQASAARTRIPASFCVAEAALESGWGTSMLATEAHNLFGVKADPSWHGPTWALRTREVVNGQYVVVPANWRSYPDWASALSDHALFLMNNPRYAHAFDCTDGEAFAHAVAAAGYSTEPDYADRLISTMRARNLKALDVVST